MELLQIDSKTTARQFQMVKNSNVKYPKFEGRAPTNFDFGNLEIGDNPDFVEDGVPTAKERKLEGSGQKMFRNRKKTAF